MKNHYRVTPALVIVVDGAGVPVELPRTVDLEVSMAQRGLPLVPEGQWLPDKSAQT